MGQPLSSQSRTHSSAMFSFRPLLSDLRRDFSEVSSMEIRQARRDIEVRTREEKDLERLLIRLRVVLASLASFVALGTVVPMVLNAGVVMDGEDEEGVKSLWIGVAVLVYAPLITILHTALTLIFSTKLSTIGSLTLDTLTTSSYLAWASVLTLYAPPPALAPTPSTSAQYPWSPSMTIDSDSDGITSFTWASPLLHHFLLLALWISAGINSAILVGKLREVYLSWSEAEKVELDLERGVIRARRVARGRRSREERKVRFEEFKAWRGAEEEKKVLAERWAGF